MHSNHRSTTVYPSQREQARDLPDRREKLCGAWSKVDYWGKSDWQMLVLVLALEAAKQNRLRSGDSGVSSGPEQLLQPSPLAHPLPFKEIRHAWGFLPHRVS